MKKILVTGSSGFIGFHLSSRLLTEDFEVIGLDNMNDYYDLKLKEKRLEMLEKHKNFKFFQIDLKDKESVDQLFKDSDFDYVINLAAQAGVRYSITNPYAYIDSNLIGFINILEACRNSDTIKHLLYASSSSVYGGNSIIPFSAKHNVDHPVSLYAATKKSNELMAHTYSHLYNIPTTGLRFFTVYGPWGRPDMAYFSFTNKILKNECINVFNDGKMERDFTYIDDIVEGIVKLIEKKPKPNMLWNEELGIDSSFAPYKIYNIGNNNPVKLEDFISTLEKHIGKKAIKNYMDMQAGDVVKTFADVSELEADIDFKPNTTIDEGISRFVSWYKSYYSIS
ncbi:NAD-dependent epimerase [Carnobacterium maltaromaticum]|uniref:NAD-dependent epimerase n=1 Tax=Carnobacterium maltaromaticum TaxID=2751 RepID=UPI00295EB888|nr:NAD-dependent epimerase [Carnobacterium maltaromaticum]